MEEIDMEVKCPKCGAHEMHPNKNLLLLRVCKVLQKGAWWSQCLVCAGYYDVDLNETPDSFDTLKGWFISGRQR